jgi:predicted CoA-binding protein
MPDSNPTSEDLRAFLGRIRTVAVIGLSHDPDRPSYSVAMYLQEQGYRVIPVRPGGGEVLGEKVYERLADVPVPIDVVDLFRAPRFVAGHIDEAILAKAPAIWMQEGVIDHEASRRAREAGLFVVMDRCILKEHRRARLPPLR